MAPRVRGDGPRMVARMSIGEHHIAMLSAGRTVEMDGPVLAIDLSPAEDVLAVECNGELSLMDPVTLEVRRRWRVDPTKVGRLEFSAGGDVLATAGYEGAVTLWDVSTGVPLQHFEGHQGKVWSVSLSPDAAVLASAGSDHSVRLWPVAGRRAGQRRVADEPIVLRGHDAPVRSVAIAPDGVHVASGDEAHELRVWRVSTQRVERQLAGHTGKVRCLRFLADGTLVSGSSDGSVCRWDVTTGARLHRLQAHGEGRVGKIRTLAFSADQQIMVTGAQDHTARVWTGYPWVHQATLTGHDAVITATAVSARNGWVFTSAKDHTLRRWSLR